MKTQQPIVRSERVDDIPLLLAQMRKIRLAEVIDEPFQTHGNWQGLSIGPITSGWLSDLRSEGDHRMNQVETWAERMLMTLSAGWDAEVRALDFSDNRLAAVLDEFSPEEKWEDFERSLNGSIRRVYQLKTERIRIDTTTAKSYVKVTEGGWLQFGHSKDHRPDRPQLQISQSALEPLGIPVTTTVVSGNCADDPLYLPEIQPVPGSWNTPGLLHLGDGQMSAWETRAYVAFSGDYYFGQLSAVPVPQALLEQRLEPVWREAQSLSTVCRPPSEEEIKRQEEPEALAEGFGYPATRGTQVEGQTIEWPEQRLVVRSFQHAQRQQKVLDARLDKAQTAIAQLHERGRGRKVLTGEELSAAVEKILDKYHVNRVLTVTYHTATQTLRQRVYQGRPARVEEKSETTVHSAIDPQAYQNAVRGLGWRVYVSNDLELGLSEAVLAYREEYRIEHGCGRYQGQVLGLTPLSLSDDNRIKGLVRLLSIGWRILCLLEFSVRQALDNTGEKLAGIYQGNPKRATASPTAEIILKAFEWINLTEIDIDGKIPRVLSPRSEVQERILSLLDFPTTIYLALSGSLAELGYEMSER